MEEQRWLTVDLFSGRVGDVFEVDHADGGGGTPEGAAVVLHLVDVQEGREAGGVGPAGQERRQFSLELRGPAEPMLPQAIHRLRHRELGEFDLFLVPIGRDADSVRYEAAFA